MQLWPHHQYSAALIARAKALMARLRLKFKRLFQATKHSEFEEILSPLHIDPALPPLEYKSAQSQKDETKPNEAKPKKSKPRKPKSAKSQKDESTPDEAQPVPSAAELVQANPHQPCEHDHAHHHHDEKKPCPHCGRPFGKQPETLTQQYLREKREAKRAQREQAEKNKHENMCKPIDQKPEKIKTSPRSDQDYADAGLTRPKRYNVRCPLCKRLIKQPFEIIGDAAYAAAEQKISDEFNVEYDKPNPNLKPFGAQRQRNKAWLLTLSIPYLKAADAALRQQPCYSDGQSIRIVVAWKAIPPHFVHPHDDDQQSWNELYDYKKKERRLKNLEKRNEARKFATQDDTRAVARSIVESLPKKPESISERGTDENSERRSEKTSAKHPATLPSIKQL